MQYLLMIYQNEAEYAKIDPATAKKRLERQFQGRRPAAADHDRDHRARA